MNNREIATALTHATEVEKAEFAQFLADALVPLGLEDSAAAKRQIVAAFDRFALPEEGGARAEEAV